MKMLSKLQSVFKFQRKYGVIDSLFFFNNTSKNVKNPFRIKKKKTLKTLKFGINSVLLNTNVSKTLFSNFWKYSFRPICSQERFFSNSIAFSSDVKNYLKNLEKVRTITVLTNHIQIHKTPKSNE